jgi:hypothetical protein
MSLAVRISINLSGLLLGRGMPIGIGNSSRAMASSERTVLNLGGFAHRNALIFSFASVLMARLVNFSPFRGFRRIVAVAVTSFLFTMNLIGPIADVSRDCPDRLNRAPNRVRIISYHCLVADEAVPIAVRFSGLRYSQFFGQVL